VLRQPKRLALLAYLAVSRPRGFHRRDTLLGLFWPELDEEHARNSLGQAVHVLRRELGSESLVNRGSAEIGLNRDLVWCDVVEFDEATEDDRPEDAMDLYRGDLLKGFYLSEADEFERWLDQERNRLRDQACEAAWLAARSAEGAGDVTGATRWARWAFTLTPYSERGMSKLVALLDRTGDRSGALKTYETFAERLNEELGADPAPETQKLIDQIRKRQEPN